MRVIHNVREYLTKGSQDKQTDLATFVRSISRYRGEPSYVKERKAVIGYHEKLVTETIKGLEVWGILGRLKF